MSGKKGKKPKTKAKVLSLGEFLAADVTPDSTIVSAPRHDDDEDGPSGNMPLVLPTCPRMARGPHVDLEKINPAGPFICHVANLPFEADESDVRRFFEPLEIKNLKLPMDREGARSKGYGYVEFNTRANLIEALEKHEEILRNRKIRVDLPDMDGMSDRGGRDGGFRRDGGSRWGDRDGKGDDRGERSQGISDWRSAPPSQGEGESRGGYDRGGFSDRERGGYSDRDRGGFSDRDRGSDKMYAPTGGRYGGGGSSRYDDDRRGGPSQSDDGPWRRSGPPASTGGYDDRDRRGGGGYGDRRGGGFDDRRGGGFGDRRGGDDHYGGFSRADDREPQKERPKLMLKPRSVPAAESREGGTDSEGSSQTEQSSSAASIFGAAKPVNTASKELEIENKLAHKSPSVVKKDVPRVSNADIFGAAKPVDTASKEQAIEEKLAGRRSPSALKKDVAPKPAAVDIFGAAKPVDTLSRELEIEKKLNQQPLVDAGTGADAWRERGSRDERRGGRGDGARASYDRAGGRGSDRNDRGYDRESRGYDRRPYDRDNQYPDRDGRSYDRDGRSYDRDARGASAHKRDDRTNRNGRVDSSRGDLYSQRNGVDRAVNLQSSKETKDYDSDEERFLKAQPKSDKPEVLSVMNKFGSLDVEENMP
ncbi:RNA recognition motif domain [Trinorchestia longiramus]|nr:RNA recognition motif domain [Trinorchestia longiramus]